MWVVSLKRLRQFWTEHARAELSLRFWFELVAAADWRNFGDLRAMFPNADRVGNCIVFNIAGNHFRLIARVLFPNHKVYVLRVMTHGQYDRIDWANECRCYEPPPKRTLKKGRK